jgi:periplasmic divalent cation tolerance protein
MQKNPDHPAIVYSTAPSRKEANAIIESLLCLRLIACGNIVESSSIYLWKNSLRKTKECVLLLKTTTRKFKVIERKIRTLSSYECPCILLIKVDAGYRPYLDWLQAGLL